MIFLAILYLLYICLRHFLSDEKTIWKLTDFEQHGKQGEVYYERILRIPKLEEEYDNMTLECVKHNTDLKKGVKIQLSIFSECLYKCYTVLFSNATHDLNP